MEHCWSGWPRFLFKAGAFKGGKSPFADDSWFFSSYANLKQRRFLNIISRVISGAFKMAVWTPARNFSLRKRHAFTLVEDQVVFNVLSLNFVVLEEIVKWFGKLCKKQGF